MVIAIYQTILSDYMYKVTYCSVLLIVLCFAFGTEMEFFLRGFLQAVDQLHETPHPYASQPAGRNEVNRFFFLSGINRVGSKILSHINIIKRYVES